MHNFDRDTHERRQYRRLATEFGLWWLDELQGDAPTAGIGVDISGGGLRFVLEREFRQTRGAIAFSIGGRRMRANILVIESLPTVYRGQFWFHYRAKFIGMLSSDFDFLTAYIDAQPAVAEQRTHAPPARAAAPPARAAAPPAAALPQPGASPSPPPPVIRRPLSSIDSFDKLPTPVKKQIVQALVRANRLPRGQQTYLSPITAHYNGMQTGEGGNFHRFSVRTQINSHAGTQIFNSDFLISDDGTKVIYRE